jgi:hypothetical protein
MLYNYSYISDTRVHPKDVTEKQAIKTVMRHAQSETMTFILLEFSSVSNDRICTFFKKAPVLPMAVSYQKSRSDGGKPLPYRSLHMKHVSAAWSSTGMLPRKSLSNTEPYIAPSFDRFILYFKRSNSSLCNKKTNTAQN